MQICEKLCKKFFHSYSKTDLETPVEVQNVQLIRTSGDITNVSESSKTPKLNLIEPTPNHSVSSKKHILSPEDDTPEPTADEAPAEASAEEVKLEVCASVHENQTTLTRMSTVDRESDDVMKQLDETIAEASAEHVVIADKVEEKVEEEEQVKKEDNTDEEKEEDTVPIKEKKDNDFRDFDSSEEDYYDDNDDDVDDNSKRLANKYGDMGGELLILNIPNPRINNCSLGLRLSGNKDLNKMSIFICQIIHNSLAGIDGRLQTGDEILEIDDHILYGRSHLNASPIIKSCSEKMIKFVIHRSARWQLEMAMPITYKYAEDLMSNPSSRRSSVMDTLATSHASGDFGTGHGAAGQVAVATNGAAEAGGNSRKVSSVSLGQIPIMPSISTEETHIAYLTKGQQGLGFAIMEGSFTNEPGIFIKHLAPMGTAAQDGSLRPGDRLVSINGHDVSQSGYDQVLELLRTSRGQVRLVVSRVRCCPMTGGGGSPAHHGPHSPARSADDHHQHHRPPFSDMARKRLSAPNISIVSSLFPSSGGGSRARSPTITEETSAEPTDEQEDLLPPPIATTARIQIKLIPESESGLHSYARNMTETRRKSSITALPSSDLVNVIFNNYQDDDKNLESVTIPRGSKPLGILIIGGSDTFIGDVIVHDLFPSGLVAQDGRVHIGDKIVAIDNVPLLDKSHGQAMTLLHCPANQSEPLQLRVRHQDKTEPSPQDHDIYEEVTTVELAKKPSKGLGISVVGREGARGVYVCDIVKGGPADVDGKLRPGDQILEINGRDCRLATQEEAATKLKCLMGSVILKIGRIHHLHAIGRYTPAYLLPRDDQAEHGSGVDHRLLNAKTTAGGSHSPGSRSPMTSPAHAR